MYEPKCIVIYIYLYEDITVQETIKIIEETQRQTNLNRKVDLIIKAWKIPLFYLESANGLRQDAVRPILKKSGIEIEQIILDFPEIAIEVAGLAAKHNCQPVEQVHHYIAKLYDTAYWKALLSHTGRSNFKQLFELIAKKHTQRAQQLIALARKDLTAEDFIAQVLDKGEDLEQHTTVAENIGASTSRRQSNC